MVRISQCQNLFRVRTEHWKRSELINGKGPNWPIEKVRIDQWKRSELTKEVFFLRSELTNKRVRTDQWSGTELTRAEFLGSGLNRP